MKEPPRSSGGGFKARVESSVASFYDNLWDAIYLVCWSIPSLYFIAWIIWLFPGANYVESNFFHLLAVVVASAISIIWPVREKGGYNGEYFLSLLVVAFGLCEYFIHTFPEGLDPFEYRTLAHILGMLIGLAFVRKLDTA